MHRLNLTLSFRVAGTFSSCADTGMAVLCSHTQPHAVLSVVIVESSRNLMHSWNYHTLELDRRFSF